MTVTTTEHGRHAERTPPERRRSERTSSDQVHGTADRRPSRPSTRGDSGAHELPPARERARRRLAEHAARIDLHGLVERHGTPLLVLDPDRVASRLLELRRLLPDVELAVAPGALPHAAFVRAVDAFGAGFTCASRGELDLLEGEGVDLGRTVHVGSSTSAAELTGAYLRGVRRFVIAHHDDLDRFAGLPADAHVLVRLASGDHEHAPDAATGRAAALGVPPRSAPDLVASCRRAGREVAGFAIRVGDASPRSDRAHADPWRRTIARTAKLMRDLRARPGGDVDTLLVDGALPLDGDGPDLTATAGAIRDALTALPPGTRVVIEAGQLAAAPALTLVTRVEATAIRDDGRWARLESGAHAAYANVFSGTGQPPVFADSELAFRPPSDEHRERVVRRLRELAFEPVTLSGPSRRGAPVIARDQRLPRLHAGDLLVSPMMGACASAAATRTGASGLPPIHVVAREVRHAAG